MAFRLNGIKRSRLFRHRHSEKPHKALGWLTPIAFEEKCSLFAVEQITEGEKVIDGKDKMKGASSPIHLGNKKPQAQNVSMEIQA